MKTVRTVPEFGADIPARLAEVARKLVWWKEPAEALRRPLHVVAQVMTFGTWGDVQVTQAAFGRDIFRQVLDDPPAGVFDEASWAYWHNRCGIRPIPRLPKRTLA